MRKLAIGAVTFLVMIGVFFVYNLVVDTPSIIVDNGADGNGTVEPGDFDKGAGSFGDTTKIAPVGVAEYVTLDETTKQVRRILGFETFEKPSKNSDIWEMEKPYMKIFEDRFKADIRSNRGKMRFEMLAGQPSPVTAELHDSVEIFIQMQDDNKQITISLDDLQYDNERSEFATEGPVKLVSEDGVMEGEGMIMLYDAEMGKLAYLEITNLKYLLLKNVVDDELVTDDTGTNDAKPATAKTDEAAKPKVAKGKPSKSETSDVPEDERYKYYQCSLNDTVNIEYGKKLVIVGADEVVISNILGFDKGSDNKKDEPSAAKTDAAVTDSKKGPGVKPADIEKKPAADDTQDTAAPRDVYVTCNGALIIQPMEHAGKKREQLTRDSRRKMEIRGRPVKVGQIVDMDSDNIETIASCGEMTYDIDNEVLDLETSEMERFVELKMGGDEASIYTEGSVKWSRKANHASIVGPGMLLVSEEQNQGNSSNMKFDGVMDVYFADRQLNAPAGELSLSMVNLVGGMVATINKEANTMVASDTAQFTFEDGRYITVADLDGNVKFNSDSGTMRSDEAQILFAKSDAGKVVPTSFSGTGNAILEPSQISGTKPTRFHAKKITYDIRKGLAIASGPVEFLFYASDKNETTSDKTEKVPVVITAQTDARFYENENQIVFNGDVEGTQVAAKDGIVQTDTFSGDQLIVDMTDEGDDDIKHVRVVGGEVKLQSERKMENVTVGNIGMTCMQIDWEAADNLIVAKGPGEIEINNENAPEPDETDADDRSFKLAGPCLGMMSGFKLLTWNMDKGHIEADGGDQSVNLGYMPIKDGERGQIVRAAAGKIACNMAEREDGRFDLMWLKTLDGIFYEEVGNHSIMGDRMHYDGQTGVMTVLGTDTEPCIVDGRVRTAYVEYNMKTGKITSRLKK